MNNSNYSGGSNSSIINDMNEFLIVDNYTTKNDDIAEFKEMNGKILIKQFSGINTDNFVLKKHNGKRIEFSFFKLNGIYYINICGHHIIDYKKFVNIHKMSQNGSDVVIKNPYFGDIIIPNCDIELFKRSLVVMNKWMKSKNSFLKDIFYYIFS
jgi:hypothetical protein